MNPTVEATEKPRETAAAYTCGVCHEPVVGDLLSFLHHTDQHVIEALGNLHPELSGGEGQHSKLQEYYRAQFGHDPWLRSERP